jgi:hypothetical protein
MCVKSTWAIAALLRCERLKAEELAFDCSWVAMALIDTIAHERSCSAKTHSAARTKRLKGVYSKIELGGAKNDGDELEGP